MMKYDIEVRVPRDYFDVNFALTGRTAFRPEEIETVWDVVEINSRIVILGRYLKNIVEGTETLQ